MKVLFVINNFYTKGNGMAASARRTVAFLKEAGVDIKILSGKNPDPEGPQPDFCLDDYTLPIFNYLVVKQGYQFSEYDRKTCREAVAWADIVHLEEPFVLECHVARYAARIGKAVTATYHLHPENLLASVHLDGVSFFSDATVRMWNTVCYSCILRVYATLGQRYLSGVRLRNADGTRNVDSEVITAAMTYINNHYREDLCLEDVAKFSGFSRYYFSRSFKKQTGYSFKDYLCQKRLQVAMDMLIRTNRPMRDVAMESGFGSVATFNRVFRENKGCTPTQYRAIYGTY